ncbi:MAG: DUF2225 domain-containing protein [Lachnospiraceae bacterium]|nr:DUF2225 domain-containing protein [Lachnospiraceae bacterium]
MPGLFAGLEKFGLKADKLNVYEEKKKEEKKSGAAAAAAPEATEKDYIFDKTFKCPCCDAEFHAKAVRAGKVKLAGTDTDLRPKYQQFDCNKYDAVVCPKCGYASIAKYFTYLGTAQCKLIKENITKAFKGIDESGDIYTYDNAIGRFKLALVSTIVKRAKDSERAYTCLKLAWVLRGKRESLPEDTPDRENVIKQLEADEKEALENAYVGFDNAFSTENLPICGNLDEGALMIILADLSRRIGKTEEAGRWISSILTSRTIKDNVKNKAREIKEIIDSAKQQ